MENILTPPAPEIPGLVVVEFEAALSAIIRRANGDTEALGVIARKMVTTAGVNALVDAFQGLFTLADFKYHASGTGIGAEAIGNTTLGTEVGSRATGSQTEGATPNIYKSVGTINYTSSYDITEHGLLSNGTAPSGTLWDRSVFTLIPVGNGDSVEFSYELTVNAGG